jgi:hypothetical protein
MRILKHLLAVILPLVFLALAGTGNTGKPIHPGVKSQGYTVIPSVITENYGQFGRKMRFKASIRDADFCFFPGEVNCVMKRIQGSDYRKNENSDSPFENEVPGYNIIIDSLVIKSVFLESNPDVIVEGIGRLPYNNNYFLGRNRDSWWTNVPNYSGIIYKDIYPEIDLQYYWYDGSLKYDFIIDGGADISQIKIKIEGADDIAITPDGDLTIESEFGVTYEKAPICYQEISGKQRPVKGRYTLLGENTFGFAVEGEYDSAHDLIVDPQLVFSTYIYPGRGYWDEGIDIAIDSEGSACVTGKENRTVFVTKFTNTNNIPVFFTNIGNYGDIGAGIAVDSQNNIIVSGVTYQDDFPVINAYDDTYNGEGDAFLLKLSPTGDSLLFSTYFGGNSLDLASAAMVDNNGNISFAGLTLSQNLPAINGFDLTHNGGKDGFVAEFNSQGTQLLFSTFIGGNHHEQINDIAADLNGDLYLTGTTKSVNFPTLNAFDDDLGEFPFFFDWDAFVTKLSSTGDSLIYSTFLGGAYMEFGKAIDVDVNGSAYITGETTSSGFPIQNPYDSTKESYKKAFVTKFSPAGNTLIFSTYLGGDHSTFSFGTGIAVDQSNNAYVTGLTRSGFPLVNPLDDIGEGQYEIYISKFTESGSCLLYSSYFGGESWEASNAIAVSDSNELWLTGWAGIDLPLVNPYDSTFNGGYWDAFLSRFVFEPVTSDIGSIEGFVDDLNTGFPIPDVQILIVETGEILNTDSLGEYNIPAICGGFYTMEFSHVEYIDTIVTSVSVVPGESTVVNISMWRNSAIAGVVQDEAAFPIENAVVTALGTPISNITGVDGSYVLNDILPGPYDVTYEHNDYCDTAVFDVVVSLGQTTYVDIALSNGGYLEGIVTDSVTGDPVGGVIVSVDSQFAYDTTDQTGSYLINGICPGTIDISFEVPYYVSKVIEGVIISYGDTSNLDVQLSPLQREVEFWFGNPDGSPIEAAIGERSLVDVYIQTADTIYLGYLSLSLASDDRYFDSLLTYTEGQIYYPLTEWEFQFKEPYSGPELPPGWSSQSISSWMCYTDCGPPLHFEEPTRIFSFVLKTVFDYSILGDTVDCLESGYHPTTGYGSEAGDTITFAR